MHLTTEEKAMAAGQSGPGIKRCMEILIKMGEAFGAERMIPLASAHTMPKEPVELLEEMTEDVAQTGVFTTLHSTMSAFSPKNWPKMGIPEAFGASEMVTFQQRAEIYRRTGFYQTYTCLPMLVGNFPRQGDFVSWIGTGAQLLVNSLVGARCNRDGTTVNLAAAITGRAPLGGLFLDENRRAEVVVELKGLDPEALSHSEWGAIGYYVGAKARHRNVVIKGLPRSLDLDRLKYLMAPLSVSGSVSICHIVGLTPEAPTLEAALGGKKPHAVVQVGRTEIAESLNQYAARQAEVDLVIFGCPHCSIVEIGRLARLLEGRTLEEGKRMWIGTPHQQLPLAQQMGFAETIEKAGGVFASACMAAIPEAPIPKETRTIATNSFKAAHYITRLTGYGVKVLVGDMSDCVSAVTGGPWKGGLR